MNDAWDRHEPLEELLGPHARYAHRALTGEHGVSVPPFVDHHVHLHLIDDHALPAGGIAAVLDLGGDPSELARRDHDAFPHAAFAGQFLTAPGGYPIGRDWAPAAVVREVWDPSAHPGVAGGAATAVEDQAAFAASVVKVVLHTGGPVLAPDVLDALVAAAHERGLPTVAHVEGEGMLRLALDAGVDALAHTPFSEWADGASIARAVATGQRWISTLALHDGVDRERAVLNLATFARAGGRVLYGTDLGNGDQPLGVNADELSALQSAGVRGPALVAALTEAWPATLATNGVATFVPGSPPADVDGLATWLTGATVVPAEELVHDEL